MEDGGRGTLELRSDNESIKVGMSVVKQENSLLRSEILSLNCVNTQMGIDFVNGSTIICNLVKECDELKARVFALEKQLAGGVHQRHCIDAKIESDLVRSMKIACERERVYLRRRYDEVLQGPVVKKSKPAAHDSGGNPENNTTKFRQALAHRKNKK